MKRYVSQFLDSWLADPRRKPLVVRGARQVGKTWLVRDLARRSGRELVELNIERRPELAEHFHVNDPARVLADLAADLGVRVDPQKTLLFIDEIQARPELLSFLRWFHEDAPDLPVVVAGSLLDFALGDHQFSMPVGRISYCHVEPVSFYEFLDAGGHEQLREALMESAGRLELSPRLHQRSMELLREYFLIGGLPEVVSDWIEHRDTERRLQLQRDLLATYADDFSKYRDRIPVDMLRRVVDAVARGLGGRFMYSHIEADTSHRNLRKAFDLVQLARICHRVEHTAARGLPLGAESRPELFKAILLDVGLVSVRLGLSQLDMRDLSSLLWANSGGLAEQFVGQHLRLLTRPFEEPRLYYWQRTDGRQAEIDYIIQVGPRIVPVEVKAGSAGAMKSLHLFMQSRNLPTAVRLDANLPSRQEVAVRTTEGVPVEFSLVSLPLYMVESVPTALGDG